ncbi:MAG TPA: hypothetical protein VN328_07020 [Thermodesulfovibrionales bacterium]|nr:hypothetical protein [Thermodesulfovibrionales bacterium]
MRRVYILLAALFVFGLSWYSPAHSEEERRYKLATPSEAEATIREIINKGDYPDSSFGKLTLPPEDLDVQGVQINEKDVVIIARMNPNIIKTFTDNPTLPSEFFDKNRSLREFALGPYYLTYLLFLSTDVELTSGVLRRKDVRIVPPVLKRGTYLWYSGANGIFLESEDGHFLLAADTRLVGDLLKPFSDGPSLDKFELCSLDIPGSKKYSTINGIFLESEDGHFLIAADSRLIGGLLKPFADRPSLVKSELCSLNMPRSRKYSTIKCKVTDTVSFKAKMGTAKNRKGFVIKTLTNELYFK